VLDLSFLFKLANGIVQLRILIFGVCCEIIAFRRGL